MQRGIRFTALNDSYHFYLFLKSIKSSFTDGMKLALMLVVRSWGCYSFTLITNHATVELKHNIKSNEIVRRVK